MVDIAPADSVTVRIPSGLLMRTGSRMQVSVRGSTIRQVIDDLERQYPGLRFNLCHETGELRPFVNVFLGSENIRYLQELDTEVPSGATIHIFHSVAGGSPHDTLLEGEFP
ncbi:MAG TPA: MoaD/ThiS family protein [Chloroflexota bacterium]|nr:MoaD/ThiS family protein [Chloroflexota bacterium]